MKPAITNKISATVFPFLALILFGATIGTAAPGDLDPTFGSGGKVITSGDFPNHLWGISDIAIQPDGKIIAVGGGSLGHPGAFAVVRYNADGSLDTSFGGTGIVNTPVGDNASDHAYSVAIQADGRIVVAGASNDPTGSAVAVVRYNPNGTLDTTFNGTGKVITGIGIWGAWGMAIQTDGKIVVAGLGETSSTVLRYNSNGSLDTSFNGTGSITTPNSQARSVAIQPDGRIVVVGSDNYQFTIYRYTAGGSPDTSFGGTGRVVITFPDTFGAADDLAIQSDGKIVAKGVVGDGETYWSALIVRLDSNGSTDTTFGTNGAVFEPYEVNTTFAGDVAVQPDGKIVTVGKAANGNYDFAVRRYHSNGSPDPTFNDGELVTTDFGFDESPWAVAIQADGKIVVAGEAANLQPSDIDIYHFALARYQGGSIFRTRFDFDGDGKTAAALFRPTSGTWYILNSGGSGTAIVNFGGAEDKPVPADYDGDGKADIAIFRPSDGSWWYLRSSDSQFRVFSFGVSTDRPVPGDWTGDGKADIAVFRPGVGTGEWFFQRSEDNSYYSVPFGASTDIPAPGDYDGDGRFDTAVFRPSTGEWFVQRSTTGILITSFGGACDRPIPNAFVP